MSDECPRVLVVEDHALVAVLTMELVEDCGCSVVGPVGSVSEGAAAVRENHLDGAVLDINLGDESVWPVAELLEERGVPFMFVTSYSAKEVPERYRNRLVLSKPYQMDAFYMALNRICPASADPKQAGALR